MMDFLTRQNENIWANIVAAIIFAALVAVVTWLSSLPPIPVPSWVFFGGAAFFAAWLWTVRRPKKMKPVVNESFGVERIRVDGKHFVDCKFEGSELVFSGKQNFSLKNCAFYPLRFKFEGAAGVTLYQLSALNKDPSFKPFVQKAIDSFGEKT